MRRVLGRLAQGPALAVTVGAVIVLAAGVLAVITWASGSAAGHPSPHAGATQPGAASPASPSAGPSGQGQQSPGQQGGQVTTGAGNVASVPMSALPSGSPGSGMIVALVIVTGVPSVSVHVAVMPGTLVQAATEGGYGARPVLDDLPGASLDQAAGMPGAAVVLSLGPAGAAGGGSQAGGQGGAALSVTLSPDVAWQLDFGGSAGPVTVDMTGGRVAGLDFAQGASDISVALPRPSGTVPLRLEGGTSQLAVSVPAGVPARVTAGDGASQVTVGGARYNGIAAGTVITQPGWAAATGRIDIDATSGVSQVQVTQG
jgi:hypothetical protein